MDIFIFISYYIIFDFGRKASKSGAPFYGSHGSTGSTDIIPTKLARLVIGDIFCAFYSEDANSKEGSL